MAVRAFEDHRIVGGNFVQIRARGKHRRLPESLNPAAAGDPFAGLCLIDARFNFGEKVFQAGDAFKIQGQLAKANAREMMVCVGQTRHDCRAVQIDNARVLACELFHCGI